MVYWSTVSGAPPTVGRISVVSGIGQVSIKLIKQRSPMAFFLIDDDISYCYHARRGGGGFYWALGT